MRLMIRYLAIWILCMLQAFSAPCQAQEKLNHAVPNFREVFEVWSRNLRVYNQLNDSVFKIHNYKDWAAFFNYRSVKVHEMYEEDKKIMQEYADYFQSNKYEITQESYNALRHELYRDLTAGKISDPFVMIAVCDVLEKEGAAMPDSIKCTNLIHALRLFGYVQMWNQGGEDDYMKMAY